MFDTQTFNDPLVLPPATRARWEFMETSSAAAVLRSVCPTEWADILDVLATFQLAARRWLQKGGNRGQVAIDIDAMFHHRGWRERRVDIVTAGELRDKNGIVVGSLPPVIQEGYLVDNFKGRVALDVEWNAKDGNLDRDLSAYRSWHEAGVISAAVLITQDRNLLKPLAHQIWSTYQAGLSPGQQSKLPIDLNTATTTNLEKAALRVRRGVMGTCPLLIVAAVPATWDKQPY